MGRIQRGGFDSKLTRMKITHVNWASSYNGEPALDDGFY